jgi:hypothetical protein
MARPTTTHVIELESGIGEPAFIPLTLGQELQPISVGKKGMWRVEGARVLDVHAFVYFDGSSLFLQSADEQSAALVDGYRVGKAWTELHAPCKIEIGGARLRFRSLIAEAQAPEAHPSAAHAYADHPADENQPTLALERAPVERPPTQPIGQPIGPAFRDTQQSPGPSHGAAASAAPAPPLSFPKQDRPFAPGAFVTKNDDESTRIAPLESTGGRPVVALSGAIPAVPAVAPPRPAAGRPVEEDLSTRPGAGRAGQSSPGTGSYAAMPGGQPMQPLPPGMVQGVMPLASMPPGMNMPPGGYPPQQQQGYAPQGYPPMGGSGAYGALPPGATGQGGPGMLPGAYGAPGPQGGPQPPEAPKNFGDIMKDPAQRKKLLALAVILLGGAYVLLMDDDPAPKQRPTAADAGLDGAPVVASSAASASAATPASPCPPGFQPYGAVQPGQPITCVPTQPAPPESATPLAGTAIPVDAGSATVDAPRPKPTGKKTLERQAIDYVAVGEYGKAIGIYEKLAQESPENKVYPETLRILRAKLDAGTQ